MPSYSTGLSKAFLREYYDKRVPWGPVGYVTYKRTYSRLIPDLGRTEEWTETLARACNGLVEIGGLFSHSELEDLFDLMFNLRGLVAGRALWQLGTETVERVGADSLCNCWIVLANHLDSFCFCFNQLMLGGGVGINILPEHVYELPPVKFDPPIKRVDNADCDFIVPDNREGWVELLWRVLKAFFITGKPLVYSTQCIRAAGKEISSFGGVASGSEPLVKGINQIVSILRGVVGRKLNPLDCSDIFNIIGTIVVSGNVRRSSEIIIGHPHDLAFLQAKNWHRQRVPNWRAMSNMTVATNTIGDMLPEFWEPYDTNGECYGLINLNNCQRYGRLADGIDYRPDYGVVGCNPCITGETKVAVADGRGAVPISKLGGDTPVYCVNDSDEVVVRMMRHPRITGRKVKVFKVTLDNGEFVRVTENHKFTTNEGEDRAVRDLLPGDGLRIMTRYVPEECKGDSRGDLYTYMSFGSFGRFYEHVEIARQYYQEENLKGKHVHHIDGNRLNNHPENLQIVQAFDHLSDHSAGESNPNFSGISNAELLETGVAFCQKLGRKFSFGEWIAAGHVAKFTEYRQRFLGTLTEFAETCAKLAGVIGEHDPRTLRQYFEMIESGYKTRVEGSKVEVVRTCEACGKEFWINAQQREQACCGFSCANTLRDTTKSRATLKKTNESKHLVIRHQQLDVYTKLKTTLGKPQKKDWQAACRKQGVSPEVSRKSSPFTSWKELCAVAVEHNHRIVSIVEDGYEDVWNGTVDDFHNFFLGCFDEGVNEFGRHRYVMIVSPNCGEASLENKEPCNLAEQFLPRIKNVGEWTKIAVLLYKAAKTIANFHYSDEDTEEVVRRNMRVGIGLSGWMGAPWAHDKDILTKVYRTLEHVDACYSSELNVPKSIKLTTVKPSGTVSLLPEGVTPGMHAAYSRYLKRRIRFAASDPLVDTCRQHGYHVEPVLNIDGTYDQGTMVVSFPMDMGPHVVTENQVDVIDELETQKFIQTYWADQSISCTHYFKPGEVEDIQHWLNGNYEDSVKTCSFMHSLDHGFKQAPLERLTAEEYHELNNSVKPITQLTDIQEIDMVDSLECEGGHCPVK